MKMQAEEFLKTEGHTVEASLRVLYTEQEGTVVAYCPSLDLSTYGDTVEDAAAAFDDALAVFIQDGQQKGTLEELLQTLGWQRVAASHPSSIVSAASFQRLSQSAQRHTRVAYA